MIRHGAKAQYGRNAGAQIEMVTRSGTNRWTGNISNHLRNTVLNANEFFSNSTGLARPKFIQNTFAATIGGPIVRNRTFVFGSYQGRRLRQDVLRNRDVLTATARDGIFRWRAPGSSTVRSFDIARNDPRGTGIDREIAALIRMLPPPNNNDTERSDGMNFAGYRFHSPAELRLDQFTARADHQLRQHVRLFFRFSWGDARGTDAFNNNDSIFPGQPQRLLEPSIAGSSLGVDWTITPHAVNELRFGHQSNRLARTPPRPREAVLITTLWTSPVNPRFAQDDRSSVLELTDHLSVLRGSHIFKIGGNWHFTGADRRNENGIYPNVHLARANGNLPPPTIGPSGGEISAAGRTRFEEMYNHLLGRISHVTQTFYGDLEHFQPAGTARERNFRFHDYAAFLQDDWKLRPNLTLNIGLRYDFHAPPSERDRRQGTLDQAAQISRVSRISDFALQRAERWYDGDYNNLAPRFGLAWAPGGDARTVIRAHYGIFYERPVPSTATLADNNTPGFSAAMPVFPNQTPGSDWRVSDGIVPPQQPAAPSKQPPNNRRESIGLFHPRLRTGYVQQYGFGVERELSRNLLMEAAFVGNRGVKLMLPVNMNQHRIHDEFLSSFREIQTFRSGSGAVSAQNTLVRLFGSVNQAVNSLGATLFNEGAAGAAADQLDVAFYDRYASAGNSDFYLRNFPQFNVLVAETNDGRSYFDSLQLSLRRQSGAVRFAANYTWSKSLDLVSTNGFFMERPVDNLNLRLNRARSDFDRPHVVTGLLTYSLPLRKRKWPRWLNTAFAGWNIGVLGIWESGAPFSVLSGRRTLAADMDSYADYTGDRNIGRLHNRGGNLYWFSAEEAQRFTAPGPGEFGTSGRNAFRGPRFFTIDLSLVKTFRLTERQSFEIRSEFYNLLNTPNFANPAATLANPGSLGRITRITRTVGLPIGGDSGGPRIVQLALRYEF